MFLHIVNFISFSIGVVLVVAGLFLTGQKAQVYDIYSATFPMALLIVVTVAIMLGAIISDTSFYKTTTSCQTFIIVLLVIFILSLELSTISGGLTGSNFVQKRAERGFRRQMIKYAQINASDIVAHRDWRRKTWIDVTQSTFKCCGLRNASDWMAIQPEPPVSCCRNRQIPNCTRKPRQWHKIGCSAVMRSWMNGEVRIFSSITLCVTVVQLVSLTIMIYLKYISWGPRIPPELAEEFGIQVQK